MTEKNKKILKYGIFGLVVICIISLNILNILYFYRVHKETVAKYNHNIEALTDSVTYYRTKNGELYAVKNIYVANIKDLKLLNDQLYSEIKSMQKELGKKNEIIAAFNTQISGNKDTIIRIVVDTLEIYNGQVLVDTFFKYKDDILNTTIQLKTNNNILYVSNMKYDINVPLSAYITSSGKLILKSLDNIRFNDIQGFELPTLYKETKKKRFGVGFNLGIGAASGYDPINKKVGILIGPYVGIGISYNIFQF